MTRQARRLLRSCELDELRARQRRVTRAASEVVAVWRLAVRSVIERRAHRPWSALACGVTCGREAQLVTCLAVVEVRRGARRHGVTRVANAAAMTARRS